MAVAVPKVSYPYIISDPDIANGAPIIKGIRTTVRAIAAYYQIGMGGDEILTSLTHLTPSRFIPRWRIISITRKKLTGICGNLPIRRIGVSKL